MLGEFGRRGEQARRSYGRFSQAALEEPPRSPFAGAVGGLIVVFAIITIDKLRIDDPVGAISVHGVVGSWGLMAVPLTNDEAGFVTQLIGLATIFAWTFVTSLIVWGIIELVHLLRGPTFD